MPAYTVSQLEPLLSQYLAPGAAFSTTLAQVLPRVYAMGLWRDLVYETSLNAAPGYISLPTDAESVLSCTINNNPRPVRSLWSDVRIVGRQAVVSPYFGIVDDGFHPVALDMKDVQGVDSEEDVTPFTDYKIWASKAGTGSTAANATEFVNAEIRITVSANGDPTLLDRSTTSQLWFGTDEIDFDKVLEIVYSNVPYAIDLWDSAYPDKIIATIPAGTGVLRVRRFRVSDAADDTTVHLLLKRACPTEFTDQTVIHLGNVNAIKHGMLGAIAEDNADLERANYHWGLVKQLLDEELDAFRGAAKPMLNLQLWGGTAPYGLY